MVSDFIKHPFHCLFALLTARLKQTNESSWQAPVAKISVPTMPLEKPQRTQSLTIESTVVQNANWLTMAVKNISGANSPLCGFLTIFFQFLESCPNLEA